MRASALLLALVLSTPAFAQEPAALGRLGEALAPLERLSRTGVLYDRVLPLAHLERLDGSVSAPAIDLATWRQGYDELRRSAITTPSVPELGEMDAAARDDSRGGVIPLALLNRRFERVRPEALGDGSVHVEGGRIDRVTGTPLLEQRVFAAAALRPRTHHGSDVTFRLDTRRYFSDEAGTVAVDFADGLGFRSVLLGEPVHVHYPRTGVYTLALRLTRADGTASISRFNFEVAALATPTPDDTLHVTASIPYKGHFGTGDGYVYLAPGHAALINPVVVIEGFDLDNSMDWDELYALLNGENLIESLRADGYDAVVLNFTDATEAIEQNGLVVAELLQQVRAAIDPGATMALVGASMGGLCSRYALAYMETHAIPHRVRTWISFDAPQAGADIPLGLQYWINFFAGQSTSAASFLATLQRPAAREMLLYHFRTPAGNTGQADPMRDSLAASLAAVGSYPTQPRRVAIANGSGAGANQGFAPGAQLIKYEYSSLFVAITGNVWAVPDATSKTIFQGSTRIIFTTTSQTVTVSGTKPWDGSPGGWRASMVELDTTAAPYGDIMALHPAHCFIPTISALGLATTNPFFDIAGAPDLLALTPFDAVYTPQANQEHVLITPENAVWARNEIERAPTAGVGDPGIGGMRLSGAPNPFRTSVRLAYTVPRAGYVSLRVFDVAGREVAPLIEGARPAGAQSATWDGRDAAGRRVAPGVYFLRLESGGETRTRRAVLLQ